MSRRASSSRTDGRMISTRYNAAASASSTGIDGAIDTGPVGTTALHRSHRRQLDPTTAKFADERERHALCRLNGHGQHMLDHFVVMGAIERFHPEQGG
jgi:hypothetical protein